MSGSGKTTLAIYANKVCKDLGYKVKIIDEDHGQTTELAIPIRSMKFYYPQGYTVIDCGEHYLDSYDLDNAFGTALHELRTNILKTQTQAA